MILVIINILRVLKEFILGKIAEIVNHHGILLSTEAEKQIKEAAKRFYNNSTEGKKDLKPDRS